MPEMSLIVMVFGDDVESNAETVADAPDGDCVSLAPTV